MQSTRDVAERLIPEVERYLRPVDAFRREGCEPRWRPAADAAATGSVHVIDVR